MSTGYPVPARRYRCEEVIKRSRFITTVSPAAELAAVHAFIDTLRAEFPDASHHCWAYRLGPPGDSARIGMSDDGEPHGSAGRPMLNVLLHSEIGNIIVVVSRYFGGTKLGTGGLVRAYSGGVKAALAALPLAEHVPMRTLRIIADYPQLGELEHWLQQHQGQIVDSDYQLQVALTLQLPVATETLFYDRFANQVDFQTD